MTLGRADHTCMFWNHGWRGKSPEGLRVMSVQSGRYGCAFDTGTGTLLRFGSFPRVMGAREALRADNDSIYKLPAMSLAWQAEAGGHDYTVAGSFENTKDIDDLIHLKLPLSLMSDDIPGEQTRMIVSGRFVQRFDMENLRFVDADNRAVAACGRVEVTALPDYAAVSLYFTAEDDLGTVCLSGLFDAGAGWKPELREAGRVIFRNPNGESFSLWTAHGSSAELCMRPDSGAVTVRQAVNGLAAGHTAHVCLFLVPEAITKPADGWMPRPVAPEQIEVRAEAPEPGTLPVTYDPERGLYWIELPDIEKHWDMETNRDLLERVRLSITNPASRQARVPLVFHREGSVPGITGLTPMLRSPDGHPLGIPVQISKNWHRKADIRILYEGPWLQAYTLIDLEPGQTFECELAIAYAQWGGVPAASHAQLSLVGYSGNQLWDEAAIGSYGESITYDPDVNLGRSIIDDVRPLLVHSMHGGKWSWTNNVGGGDFLVYFNEHGHKQYLTRMKAWYEHYGPNLTNAHYAGASADGKIEAHLRVSSPRCDDLNRAFHWFRYEVKAPVTFSRLAFYQLGSDGYNNHQFNRMARGNLAGMIEEWEPSRGGLVYERTGMPCEGDQPWFSLHDAVRGLHHDRFIKAEGPWANRGMVVRSWKARLGGKDAPIPHASVFLTEDCIGSANVELSPPPGMDTLLPGDFVECLVEFLVLPMHAEDYYGPNEGFRRSLLEGENTWQPVYRQACGNHLQVTAERGTLISAYPVIIRADAQHAAEFCVSGGVSYVPVCIAGLPGPNSVHLEVRENSGWHRVDQSVHGNDFWQTEYEAEDSSWMRIYNVPLGGYDAANAEQRFRVVPGS